MHKFVLSSVLATVLVVSCNNSDDRTSKTSSEKIEKTGTTDSSEILARRALVQKALNQLQKQSLYSDDIDWNTFSIEYEKLIAEIMTTDDMKVPLTAALNRLRDHHGRFIYKGKIFSHFTDWERIRITEGLPTEEAVMRQFELEHAHEFKSMGKRTGYIKIKGIGPNEDVNEQSTLIRSNLDKLAARGVGNWIIDLRYNTGGNMYPMMAGLGSLFCDGLIGGEANSSNEIIRRWSMKSGNFFYGENNYVQLPISDNVDCTDNVAVLTSRYTASSGEIIAIAFKGRPRTKFIGESTGGFTTVTNWQPISDDLTMSISVSYYADRNNVIYKTRVSPDIDVEFNPELKDRRDPTIAAAQEWIAVQSIE